MGSIIKSLWGLIKYVIHQSNGAIYQLLIIQPRTLNQKLQFISCVHDKLHCRNMLKSTPDSVRSLFVLPVFVCVWLSIYVSSVIDRCTYNCEELLRHNSTATTNFKDAFLNTLPCAWKISFSYVVVFFPTKSNSKVNTWITKTSWTHVKVFPRDFTTCAWNKLL